MESRRLFTRIAWRLIPFMGLLYVVNFLDRVNIGFAALTMNQTLGLGAEAFGIGAGIFFFGYVIFEVPSNVLMEKFGARLWIFRIMLTWGLVSMGMAYATDIWTFYALRFLLGVAEAGFFPGMMLYLTYWFPQSERGKFNGLFFCALPLASVIGGPLSGWLLGFDGIWGLHGWQWLFLLEGLPAILLAFTVLWLLPDNPQRAKFLTPTEKNHIAQILAKEAAPAHGLRIALRDKRVWILALSDIGIVIAIYGISFFMPQIIKEMGFTNQETGFVVAIPYLATAIGMFLWARSSDRGSRTNHIAAACLFGAAGFAGAALLGSNLWAVLALTCASIGIYSALVTFWTIPPSFLGGTAAAGGIALINSIGNVGGFIGPTMMGWLRETTGLYSSGLWMLALFLLVPATVALALGRSRSLALAPAPR